jgi:hypothetical protein
MAGIFRYVPTIFRSRGSPGGGSGVLTLVMFTASGAAFAGGVVAIVRTGGAMTTDETVAELAENLIDEAAPPDAAELEAAVPDVASADAVTAGDDAEQPPVPELAQPEIEHPVGSLRQAIIDHLTDTEGPQTVGQILAALPVGTSRNTAEGAIRRAHAAGEIERVGAGLYLLGKPKSAEQSKPAAPDPAPSAEPEPQPDPEKLRLEADRVRKREQRRRDAGAAAARQMEADRQLRQMLLAEVNGNFEPGPDLDDVSPIRLALVLELVPLDTVQLALKRHDPKLTSPTVPLLSWRDPALLKRIAELYCRFVLTPRLVEEWSKPRRPAARPADASEAAAAGPPAPIDPENAPAGAAAGAWRHA